MSHLIPHWVVNRVNQTRVGLIVTPKKCIGMALILIKYFLQAFPSPLSSLFYSFTSLLMQYIIPSIIVACTYLKMYFIFRESTKKLTAPATSFKILRNAQRRKRTNIILMLISAVFFISWAPLNILTILIKTANPFTVSTQNYTKKGLMSCFPLAVWAPAVDLVWCVPHGWYEFCLHQSYPLWVP